MKVKGFFAEFKEFLSRGSVLDMAIGIIIGTAFTKIVTSLVNDILMPFITAISSGVDVTQWAFQIAPDVSINYGIFIQSVIDFILIGLFVFIMVKVINSLHRKKEEAPPAPAAPSKEELLLTEIRDLLKKQAEATDI